MNTSQPDSQCLHKMTYWTFFLLSCSFKCRKKGQFLMANWLGRVSQGHEMYRHDLEVMGSNSRSGQAWGASTSAYVVLEPKICFTMYMCTCMSVCMCFCLSVNNFTKCI